MNNQILLIHNFDKLFEILNELKNFFNFEIKKVSIEDLNQNIFDKNYNILVFSKEKKLNITNQFIYNKFPIKILDFIERVNIEFIKLKFNKQSLIIINRYNIDLNSREMLYRKKSLKLTEKECEIIIYLSKSTQPVSISELEQKVWDYSSKLETHTVETHIYRLRKKIFKDLFTRKYGPKVVKPKKGKGSFKRKKVKV